MTKLLTEVSVESLQSETLGLVKLATNLYDPALLKKWSNIHDFIKECRQGPMEEPELRDLVSFKLGGPKSTSTLSVEDKKLIDDANSRQFKKNKHGGPAGVQGMKGGPAASPGPTTGGCSHCSQYHLPKHVRADCGGWCSSKFCKKAQCLKRNK